jgi:outer membrane lipoprotein-sorting protein
MGRLIAALSLAFMASAPVAGRSDPAPPAAEEILKRAEEIRSPDLDYAVDLTLVVRDPNSFWKERSASYTMVAHGKDHSFILMREPRQFHPGTLLIMNNLYWMLYPRAEKPLQLSSQQILSGDVSNGDLARGNLLKHYHVRVVGEETVEQDPCWVLELTRADYVANYPRIKYWVTRKKFQPRRFEYYGETERLLKIVLYDNYRKGPLGTRPMRIEVRAQAQPSETTTMTFTDLRRIDVTGLTFDLPGLTAFRDAARSQIGADGAQARPEDLVALLRSRGP